MMMRKLLEVLLRGRAGSEGVRRDDPGSKLSCDCHWAGG